MTNPRSHFAPAERGKLIVFPLTVTHQGHKTIFFTHFSTNDKPLPGEWGHVRDPLNAFIMVWCLARPPPTPIDPFPEGG
jgi:hypothetical protein